jgi:hypothetical protein
MLAFDVLPMLVSTSSSKSWVNAGDLPSGIVPTSRLRSTEAEEFDIF